LNAIWLNDWLIPSGKDADSCDNDYFLCPASITSHDGKLQTGFNVENRLLPQVRGHGIVYLSGFLLHGIVPNASMHRHALPLGQDRAQGVLTEECVTKLRREAFGSTPAVVAVKAAKPRFKRSNPSLRCREG